MTVYLYYEGSGNRVGDSHFGANYLANRQYFNQTIEGEALYPIAVDALGIGGLRYPGGTLAEEFFDIADPRHFENYDSQTITVPNYFNPNEEMTFTTLGNFLRYAAGNREGVTVVVPTVRYFEALASGDVERIQAVEDEIKAFVAAALSSRYGRWIEAFEIGNEFPSWIGGHNEAIMDDSLDFAMITRNFAVWLEEAMQDAHVAKPPAILAQAAFVLYGERGNKVLLEGLFDENLDRDYAHVESVEDAFRAIDGVTVHSYPLMPWTTDEYGLENLERDIILFDRWQMAFDDFALQANLHERDLATYITEWNTRNLAMNNGMVEGLQGATGTLASFYYLVSSGVDVMHVWPVLQTSTSALLRTSDLDLSINYNGAAFSILRANTIGLRAHLGNMHYDIDSDGQNDILVQLFTSENRAMIIVASISDDHLTFDLSLPVEHFDFNAAEWSSFSLVSSSLDPKDIFSQPRIDTTSNTVTRSVDSEAMYLDLPPWNITFSTFQITDGLGELAETLPDDAAVPLAFSLYADLSRFESTLVPDAQRGFVHLTGTSARDLAEAVPGFVLDAQGGDDTILGSAFDDTLIGGQGNDLVLAGAGNDVLLFASGDDRYEGEGFIDSIHAGDGDDTISAGGGASGDYVDAGSGNDIIYFDSAPNLLIGGVGDDQFHFQGGSVFDDTFFAFNASSPRQIGTGEWLSVAGMTQNASFLDGGIGYDILFLTSESDAFFLADEYSEQFDTVNHNYSGYERLAGIEEIRAGDGDDLIDLTRSQPMQIEAGFAVYGEDGDDTIWGFEGNDLLDGGNGDDVLFGGAGKDTLVGGNGADTFVFTGTSGQSVILDFTPEAGDRVEFVSSSGFHFDRTTLAFNADHISIEYLDALGSRQLFTVALQNEEHLHV